jgi:hypothetical protein
MTNETLLKNLFDKIDLHKRKLGHSGMGNFRIKELKLEFY